MIGFGLWIWQAVMDGISGTSGGGGGPVGDQILWDDASVIAWDDATDILWDS